MTRLATPVRNTLRLDEVSDTVMYIGEAAFGQNESNPVWRIKKVITVGTVLSVLWADGDDRFDNIWADRLTLTYN